MFDFLLTSLIAGVGIVLGGVLSVIARDEVKSGRKYFLFMKYISYSAVVITAAVYYFNVDIMIAIFCLLLIIPLFVNKFHIPLLYLSFSIIYILSYVDKILFFTISVLIFFAGFPIGTLAAQRMLKEKEVFIEWKLIRPYIIFVVFSSIKFFSMLF